eukprot:173619_1
MSYNNHSQITRETLEKCPDFVEFNHSARQHLQERYTKHNTERTRHIKKCSNMAIKELHDIIPLSFRSNIIPKLVLDPSILNGSIKEMKHQINKSPTVQAHKCKKKITDYPQFLKKANNRQDQNSWKVSGEYFFVPYIRHFRRFMDEEYATNIINMDVDQIENVVNLGCILFAVFMLRAKVKFDRAKEKPLIRDRTLVNSGPLHQGFKELYSMIDVPTFIIIEKSKRKKTKKKIKSKLNKNYKFLIIF